MTRCFKPIWTALGAFLALLALAACTTPAGAPTARTPAPAATEVVHAGKLGQRVTAQGVAVTVEQAQLSQGTPEAQTGAENTFLLVRVTVENTSTSGDLAASAGDFDLRPDGGERIDFTPVNFVGDPLQDITLKPGAGVTGTVAYRIAQNLKGLHVLYDYNDQHIDIDLGF